jgi:hypothetical protein
MLHALSSIRRQLPFVAAAACDRAAVPASGAAAAMTRGIP